MAYINSHKSTTVKSELDIFAIPPTQNSIENGSFHCYRPISAIADASPIEFHIPGHGDEYIDLPHTALHIVVKIIPDAVPENTQPNVGPINNFLHSIFSQVDVYLNQKCITPPSNHYNYRAYIENLLNYWRGAKESHLQTALWYKDTAGEFDTTNLTVAPGHAVNYGYIVRRNLTHNGAAIDLFGNLHCDLFNQDKFLINGIEMSVKLTKGKDEFHLIGTNGGRIQIVDANLYVRKVKINPSILIAHARTLNVATAKYPITRVEIKTYTISKDIQSKTIDNLYLGQMPKRCVIGFVKSEAFNGSFTTNPYNFESFSYNFLSLYVDSIQIPAKPLTPDYSKRLYARSYHTLFSGSGVNFGDTGNDITYDDYPYGFCLGVFDLTNDLSSHEAHWNIIRSGCLRLEVRFERALAQTVTAVIFSEFDNLIEIDKHRNIVIDYSS